MGASDYKFCITFHSRFIHVLRSIHVMSLFIIWEETKWKGEVLNSKAIKSKDVQ